MESFLCEALLLLLLKLLIFYLKFLKYAFKTFKLNAFYTENAKDDISPHILAYRKP